MSMPIGTLSLRGAWYNRAMRVLEGTREEIASRASEFLGKRVCLTVLDDAETPTPRLPAGIPASHGMRWQDSSPKRKWKPFGKRCLDCRFRSGVSSTPVDANRRLKMVKSVWDREIMFV